MLDKIKVLPVYYLYHKTCHYLMLYKNDKNGVASVELIYALVFQIQLLSIYHFNYVFF